MIATITTTHDSSVRKVCSNSIYNRALLSDGTFGDCIVRCQRRSWHAHRSILSPRCAFFNVCFNGQFSESSSGKNEVRMDDDDPDAVEGLLEYLYTLEYPGTESRAATLQAQWTKDFGLYEMGDKYDLPELMRLARESLLAAADTEGVSRKEVLLKNLDGFVGLIDDLYASDTPPSERAQNLRVEFLGTFAELITQNIRDPRLAELVAAQPEFALDLLEALARVRMERETALPGAEVRGVKPQLPIYIPMNEDSDSEYE